MRNIIDWIQGDKFQALAKFVFAPQCGGFPIDDYRGLTNTLDINLLQDYDIIYTHTFYVKEFFKVIKDVNKKFILISHSCDSNIDESYIIPDNLIKWYSHTFKIIDPRCIRVPLGQENDRRDFGVMKKEKMDAKLREIRNIENLVYVNHVIENNPESRTYPYQYFKDKLYATIKHGCSFDEYIDDVYNHKFIVSPEGSGMECHRTWESLWMGSIPIEIKNINNQILYKDLPILLIDSWDQCTEEFLNKEYERIKLGTWCIEKLNFEYWKNLILNEKWFNEIHGFFTYPKLYADMVAKFPSGSSFIEVGVLEGQSLAFLIMEVINSGKDIKITAIDSFSGLETGPDPDLKRRFINNMAPMADKFRLIIDQSWDAANYFPDKSLDFVFIDACHEYESVKKDILAWMPKIKEGGILSGHDYGQGFPGVKQSVDEIFGNKVNLKYIGEICWLINL